MTAPFVTVLLYLVCLVYSLITLSVAQTTVIFELNQLLSTISDNEVDAFKTILVNDLIKDFGFPNNAFQNVQITNTTDGRIKVHMTLEIDTGNGTLIKLRNSFKFSLETESYSFVYNKSAYSVKGSSVVVTPSFQDYWFQFAFEIYLAIVAALTSLAIFIFALICYSYYMKRKSYREDTMFEMSGRENRAYVRGKDTRHNGHRHVHDRDRLDTLASVRGGPPDTLFNKLIHASYSVPKQHMFNFL